SAPKTVIGLIQTAAGGSLETQLLKTAERIKSASQAGARVICLQELCCLPYFCRECREDFFDLAETVPGPTIRFFSDLARQLEVVVIVPFFEKRDEGIYHNSAAVIDADGTLMGLYRKMHLPNDPFFYEKFYFAPGDLGFRVFETRYGTFGVLICWDQWFPEAARLAALQGAQILFYPSAIGWHDLEDAAERQVQLEAWQVVQRGHAIANEVFVAAVNRVGSEGPLTFWGTSFATDPFGKVLGRASATEEQNLIVECDFARIAEVRRSWPFFRDRRADAYQGLQRRFIGPPE
ncbi:MAG: carbon-nitrogen hydrolase, partial [Candidatus Omnitrophota bacterium]